MTLVISGLGYEGIVKVLVVKGSNVKTCLKKAYMNLQGIEDNEELEEYVEDYKDYDEEQWIDELECGFDSSEWCMVSIYDVKNDEMLYEGDGEIEYIK